MNYFDSYRALSPCFTACMCIHRVYGWCLQIHRLSGSSSQCCRCRSTWYTRWYGSTTGLEMVGVCCADTVVFHGTTLTVIMGAILSVTSVTLHGAVDAAGWRCIGGCCWEFWGWHYMVTWHCLRWMHVIWYASQQKIQWWDACCADNAIWQLY